MNSGEWFNKKNGPVADVAGSGSKGEGTNKRTNGNLYITILFSIVSLLTRGQ